MIGQTSDDAVAICDRIAARSDDALALIVAGASLDRAVVEVLALHAFVTMASKTATVATRGVMFDPIPVASNRPLVGRDSARTGSLESLIRSRSMQPVDLVSQFD